MSRNHVALVLILAAAHTATAQSTTPPAAKPALPGVKPVWPDEGPFKWAPRPTVTAITANDLRTRLYQFADDSMMGRKVGEPGNFKGTTYIAGEFKRLGLKPAGDNGTYFQELAYGPSSFDSVTARLAIGGTALTPRTDWIPMAPAANNGIVGHATIAAVLTVYAGVLGDTATHLDPAMFKGKIAVFAGTATAGGGRGGRGGGRGAGRGPQNACSDDQGFPNQRGASDALALAAANAGRGGRGGGGRGGPAAGTRGQAIGAVGVLVAALDSTPANTVANIFNRRAQAMQVVTGATAVPAATISVAAMEKIFGKSAADLTIGTVGQPVSGTWNYEFHMSATPARNVIAMLSGSDPTRATEYVIVGAHNDHNGILAAAVDHDSLRAFNTIMRPQGANDMPTCRPNVRQQFLIDSLIKRARSIRPPRRDSIMNGADDDGSGTVVMLEIAEAFAKEHPARSIIFISHVGEEAGLLGSKWFVDHPTVPLDSVAAVFNMDMVGKGRVIDVKFGGPSSVQTLGSRRMARDFGDIIDSVNAISKEPMAIDKTWEVKENPLNRFCRSDQVNYVNHNVPVTYFSLGYGRDYHQPTDEAQYIDYDHAARLGRFIHDVMTAVADRKDRPKKDGPDTNMPSCAR